jgi:hypothetical protein
MLINSRSKIYELLLVQPEGQRVYLDAGCALFQRQEMIIKCKSAH